jgi:pyruvate dehydrogenase E1 component alpha subunit
MLKIRLWETKIKDLVISYFVIRISYFERRKTNNASRAHRGHGHLIAKGGDLNLMPAEITHKATGKRNAYLVVRISYFVVRISRDERRGTNDGELVVSFGGDGSIQGSFFTSAANSAATYKLPWISVIENNQFQIWVRSILVSRISSFVFRETNDEERTTANLKVMAVYNVARYAVEKARSGGGPTLIECKTYRWYDHYGTGGAQIGKDGAFGLGYRSDRELRDWMAKDPIPRFRRFLVNEKVLTEERADEIVAEVGQAVEKAAAFAEAQPVPKPQDGLLNVFAEGAVALHKS